MPRNVVEATVRSAAPRAVVWGVLADVRSWSDWGDWQATELEREGDPPPDGVGAIRRIVRRPVTVREQVELWEPPMRFGYTLLSGLPVRDYHAVVTLTEAGAEGDCTNIHWKSSFDAMVPGTNAPLRAVVQKVLRDIAEQVACESERRASATG